MSCHIESDIWDMELTTDEGKLSFTGKTPKTIKELLLGCKQFMEDKKKKIKQNG